MKMKFLWILIPAAMLVAVAQAEFRVWSSKDGMNNIEAQFIQMSGNKVVLEKQDGSRIMVPKDKLCAKDQEYLAGIIPPKIKIDVDEDSSRIKLNENNAWTDYEESISAEAVIKKVNKDPCTQQFKAYVYLIAIRYKGGIRKVIGSADSSFSFERKNTAQLNATGKVQYENYVGTGKMGWKYDGYIVVVENEQGQIIQVESSKSTYESKLDVIRKNKDGGNFDL